MISVIMAVYKEDVSLLKQSIESILNQTYRDFEYVIVTKPINENWIN